MLYKRDLCRHAVSVKTNKHIFKFFFTVRYPSHSSFSAKRHRYIPTGVELLMGGRRQVG